MRFSLSVLLLLFLCACGPDSDSSKAISLPEGFDPESIVVDDLSVVVPYTEITVREGTGFTMPVYLLKGAEQDQSLLKDVQWDLHIIDSSEIPSFRYDYSASSNNNTLASTELQLSYSVGMHPIKETLLNLEIIAKSGNTVTSLPVLLRVLPVDAPDIYLLVGQSNMEGYSEEEAKNTQPGGPDERHPQIWQLNVHGNTREHYPRDVDFLSEAVNTSEPLFAPAEDPLHQPRVDGAAEKRGSTIGPGLSFAKAAIFNTSQRIYLVPAAWAGTGFCADEKGTIGWNARMPSNPALNGTLLVDRALVRLNMTLRETGGIFRGIVWHQGESDSVDQDCAESYAGNLQEMVARIRTEARQDIRGAVARGPNAAVPFVLGTMSRGRDSRGDYSDFTAGKLTVDQVHRNVAASIAYSNFANADDLVPPAFPCGEHSCIHFGAAAYRELGIRLYQAMIGINL